MAPKNNPTFGKKNKAARAIQALVRGNQTRKRVSVRKSNNGKALASAAADRIPNFGSLSAISTAPVAIGNSMRGFKSRTFPVEDGIRIVGRDYAFTPAATGSVTGWACTGGMPLTPVCMPTTVLRNLVQMYSKFQVRSMTFHYITSSSTSTTGDIVFYNQKDTNSSMINWTASSFLPFVLSDPENIIGPQWTNHSITVRPPKQWKLCDPFLNSDQNDAAPGDIFLMSKTASTESPGYVIVDYDIVFKGLEYNPRAAYLPLIAAQWTEFSLGFAGANVAGTALTSTSSGTTGIGGTTITAFSTSNSGDIYKLFIDVTNSTFSATTAANFLETLAVGNAVAETLADGYTFYLIKANSTAYRFYPTLEAAISGGTALAYGVTATYAETLRGYAKYVATIKLSALNYNV
jgi:hypothetical protein